MDEQRTKVFVSYSHQDGEWLKRLRVHLEPLVRKSTIELWDDTRINPGSKWNDEIQQALDSAKVAILLVSADFMASDYIASHELPRLLRGAEEEGAIILPVIVSPSGFQRTPDLSQFQAVNDPSKPLMNSSKGEQEAVFDRVAETVERTVGRRELRANLDSVQTQLNEINRRVSRLFLMSMSEVMYQNLRKIVSGRFGRYALEEGFRRELYHLRELGYIDVMAIRQIPHTGEDLSQHVGATPAGREYVELREHVESPTS